MSNDFHEIKKERSALGLKHQVNYRYRPQNETWWWECVTCGDEGGPFDSIEDAIKVDVLHEQEAR